MAPRISSSGIDLVDVVFLDERQDLVEGLEREGFVGLVGFRGLGRRGNPRGVGRGGEESDDHRGREEARIPTFQGLPPNAGNLSEYTTLFPDCRGKPVSSYVF